nr:hypothetical protein B0A51_07431 [Rachicladosporium sp. CCFEE 5018]
MSAERNPSAVRNLRSLFENKQQEDPSPSTRGRSPICRIGSSRDSNSSPLSRVRASFVSVDRSGHMAVPAEQGRESSMSAKRESGGTTEDGSVVGKDVMNGTPSKPSIFGNGTKADESAVDTPAATPAAERTEAETMPGSTGAASKPDGLPKDRASENESPATLNKPIKTSEATDRAPKSEQRLSHIFVNSQEDSQPAQEPTATPKPDRLKTESSGSIDAQAGAARSTPQQTPAPAASKAVKSPSKPSSVSTKSSTKVPASLKSPVLASQPKSPPSAKQRSPKSDSARVIDRRPSRSSLTAPTAASVARAASSEKRESLTHKTNDSTAKPRPREPTKAADISSRLLAPTAASRARHEAETASKSSVPAQKALPSRPKPSASSVKPTPRGSLAAPARPESRSSQATSRRPAAPPDGSFLDRMTRPTASSASRVHDKVEVKSPPRKKGSAPSKPNGVAKTGSKVVDKVKDAAGKVKEKVTGDQAKATVVNGDAHEHAQDSHGMEAKVNGVDHRAEQEGAATPVTNSGDTAAGAALEATPAFGEQEIR